MSTRDAAPLQRPGQRDGQRRFARAAGGEVADADDRITQPRAGCPEEAQLAKGERQPVERIERKKKAAGRGI